ncbi:Uncharacterised protein [Mycobacterium tuberculosis]|nr:Uncharacterised protein [Mycobacterium tuberculosis]
MPPSRAPKALPKMADSANTALASTRCARGNRSGIMLLVMGPRPASPTPRPMEAMNSTP